MNRPAATPGGGRSGFTLIEAMMALALTAAIVAALATVAAQWLPSWNRGMTRVQRGEAMALGLERLVTDLAAAEIVPIAGEAGDLLFEGTALAVTFVRSASGPNTVGLEIIRLAEIGSERGVTMVRVRAPYRPAERAAMASLQPSFRDPVALVTAPYRVSFAYAGPDGRWRDAWPAGRELPRAVRVTVRDSGSARVLPLSTTVEIRTEIAARCARMESLAACLEGRPAARRAIDGIDDGLSSPRGGSPQ
ncbi:hypothetical protein RHODGE_RHODGE_04104 [Rhodoplanes serenus]|uniref:General secretion pathway protein J n=2 Tax=Nitrobacteraceae TaxID=41294 RepID=A0A3S4CJ68_9BRAD|nr:prepilin-type N-terminal cleavage/methylation domain-containing protein [Rhodoplanes serenus]VCU10505.1 hypothetical protein RHODGE_RHODGE_04104 [Rhodoplanes serenus]